MSNGTDDRKDNKRIYLYCLIKSPQEHPFGSDGLAMSGIGGRDDEVYTIAFSDLSFVVSECAKLNYESNRANTICHQKVIEEVMERSFNPLPVRFNTIATAAGHSTAAQRLQKVLRRRYGEFQGLLRDMADKVELGLKAYWYKDRLFADIVAENREVESLRDRIAFRPSSGLAWRDERIRLGIMINNAIEAKRDAEAATLVRALRPLAYDYKTNKVSIDRMVLNGAFLVYKERIPEFDAKVDELDEKHGERMKFNYVGALPPFNFIEIIIHWDEEEDEAWEEDAPTLAAT